jgi:hypothetical protein
MVFLFPHFIVLGRNGITLVVLNFIGVADELADLATVFHWILGNAFGYGMAMAPDGRSLPRASPPRCWGAPAGCPASAPLLQGFPPRPSEPDP